MGVIERLKQLRDSYVTRQVERARLPEFGAAPVIRSFPDMCRESASGSRFCACRNGWV